MSSNNNQVCTGCQKAECSCFDLGPDEIGQGVTPGGRSEWRTPHPMISKGSIEAPVEDRLEVRAAEVRQLDASVRSYNQPQGRTPRLTGVAESGLQRETPGALSPPLELGMASTPGGPLSARSDLRKEAALDAYATPSSEPLETGTPYSARSSRNLLEAASSTPGAVELPHLGTCHLCKEFAI